MASPMDPGIPPQTRLRVADLRQGTPTRFAIVPDAEDRAALAETLGASALRKLRFEGTLTPRGGRGWALDAKLGATVVQPCIVSLEPVTTRLDETVARRFVPPSELEAPEAGSETETPEDDTLEPLGDVIDLVALMAEALALALPAYPRKDGAALGAAQFAEDGVTPMDDEAVRPFAGLAALKQKMQDDGNNS